MQDDIGKTTTNGPEGTVSAKTKESVKLIDSALRHLQETAMELNPLFTVDLRSCLTFQVESLHAVQHLKNNDLPHMLEHAIAFGNTVKESLKRLSVWSAYYFTSESSYYPVPKKRNKIC